MRTAPISLLPICALENQENKLVVPNTSYHAVAVFRHHWNCINFKAAADILHAVKILQTLTVAADNRRFQKTSFRARV